MQYNIQYRMRISLKCEYCFNVNIASSLYNLTYHKLYALLCDCIYTASYNFVSLILYNISLCNCNSIVLLIVSLKILLFDANIVDIYHHIILIQLYY